VSDTVTVPWSLQTGSQSQTSLPALQSFLTDTGETKVFTPLALGGTRESDTTYTHDSYGRGHLHIVGPGHLRPGRGHLHHNQLRDQHVLVAAGPARRGDGGLGAVRQFGEPAC
jgi:hypothetical protein